MNKMKVIILGLLAFLFLELPAQDTIRFHDGSTQLVSINPASILQDPGKVEYRKYPEGSEDLVNTPLAVASFTRSATNVTYAGVDYELKKSGTENEKGKRFGEVLLDGKVRLIRVELFNYEFDDQVNGAEGYFYILEKEKESYQLDVMNTISAGGRRSVSPRYRNILDYALSDCSAIKSSTKNLRFTDTEMIRLLMEYNACVGNETSRVVQKKSEPSIIVHSVGGGVYRVGGGDYANSIGFHVGYEGEFIFPGKTSYLGFNYGIAGALQSYEFLPSGTEVQQTGLQLNFGLNVHASISSLDAFIGYVILINAPFSDIESDDRAGKFGGLAPRIGFRTRRFEASVLRINRRGNRNDLTGELFPSSSLVRLGIYYRLR